MPNLESVVACHLGRVAYLPTWRLQESIKHRLIEAKKNGEFLSHVILSLEHPPVFTMGKSGDDRNLKATGNAQVVHINRGGDVTYHGPGQLVVYFLIDLDRFFRDLHQFMRHLEEIIIRTLNDCDLEGFRIPGRTGVWVGSKGNERKICAFGIHTSRWVTSHGLALNVSPDLNYFNQITPCGIMDRGVTSIAKELNQTFTLDEISKSVLSHFNEIFDANTLTLDPTESYQYLERLTKQVNLKESLHVESDENSSLSGLQH
ncbi:MAG: lipoyl(octanoyl) transferase LipB [Bacteroidetes bacterium]|nr:lipoyl(octanoyl) transferase LipB [Bacteroidota bacterium]